MKHNVGRPEAVARATIGVGVIALGIFLRSWWGLLGLIPIATSMLRWCPLNAAVGRDTHESGKHPKDLIPGRK